MNRIILPVFERSATVDANLNIFGQGTERLLSAGYRYRPFGYGPPKAQCFPTSTLVNSVYMTLESAARIGRRDSDSFVATTLVGRNYVVSRI
jgi:hypothetical protein